MRLAVSDYMATGEGRTLAMLVISDESDMDTIREYFTSEFGEFMCNGLEVHEWNSSEFGVYSDFIPSAIMDTAKSGVFFTWVGFYHLNLS